MAFSKKLFVRGVEGGYIRPVAWRFDDNERELSAIFALYVDKAHSERCKPSVAAELRDRPLLDVVAKLRVHRESYDAAFNAVAMAAAAEAGIDVRAMLYDAAKAVSAETRKTGKIATDAEVISDFGGDVFADAKAV